MVQQVVGISTAVLQGEVGTLNLVWNDLSEKRAKRRGGGGGGGKEWGMKEVKEWDFFEEGWGGWEGGLIFAVSISLENYE